MSRPRLIAFGALVLLLGAAAFVPRGDDDDGAIAPSGTGSYAARAAETAGFGTLTPELQRKIDSVVARGASRTTTFGRVGTKQTPEQLVDNLVRCADFEGQRYCLGSGWTEDTQAQVRARMVLAARAATSRGTLGARGAGALEQTGDLDAAAVLARTARLSPTARAAQERAELTMAARSVAKVWLLRHEIGGTPLPTGFLDAHPEARVAVPSDIAARAATKASATTTKTGADYPRRGAVLDTDQVAEQVRTYWCGPAAMQMLTWGWKDKDRGQQHWADLLGTTSSGSGITDMVRVLNEHTGWDNKAYAGAYVTLDIAKMSYAKWMLLILRQVTDRRAPVIMHPILSKQYYPYLDDDASGHFQVGRGYDKRGQKPNLVGYFEPWNQQRFDPSEPSISRVQWRSAYKSYRANEAHFQHNIGV